MFTVLVLLASTVIFVTLFRKVQLPPILGYLFVGFLLGPHNLGLMEDSYNLELLAELGIVFLLFTIGLELPLPQFIAMRRLLFALGGLQVFSCIVLPCLIFWLAGYPWEHGFVIGAAISLSSTAIVTKQLPEQNELHTKHGKLSFSMLIFQDIAAVPFLIVIPVLVGNNDSSLGMALTSSLINGVIAFAIIMAAGRWLLKPFFQLIALTQSTELFMLAVLLVALTAGEITHMLGLSMALGAFLAGIGLGESEYRHQIEADIRPFKDILLGLFFVTVGMLLDFNIIVSEWDKILFTVFAIIIGKGLIVTGLSRLIGTSSLKISLRSALIMAHSGEFGFAIMSLGMSTGILEEYLGSWVLTALVISMILSAFMVRYNSLIVEKLMGNRSTEDCPDSKTPAITDVDLSGTVVLCGFGRVGQTIARFLQAEKIPYVALEKDPRCVSEASLAGEPVFYGDSSRADILQAAGLEKAKLVILSMDDINMAKKVLINIRERCKTLPILVRTRDDSQNEELLALGASEIVPELLEASLMLVFHALMMLGLSSNKVYHSIRQVKQSRYQLLKGFFEGDQPIAKPELANLTGASHSIDLQIGANAIDKPLTQLLAQHPHVTFIKLRRDATEIEQVTATLTLSANDIIVVSGQPENLEAFERTLLVG